MVGLGEPGPREGAFSNANENHTKPAVNCLARTHESFSNDITRQDLLDEVRYLHENCMPQELSQPSSGGIFPSSQAHAASKRLPMAGSILQAVARGPASVEARNSSWTGEATGDSR